MSGGRPRQSQRKSGAICIRGDQISPITTCDLLRNRQTKSRMFAKGLTSGPFRIETVENLLQPSGRNARPLILNRQADGSTLALLKDKGDFASPGRKGDGIAKQIIQNLNDPAVMHLDKCRCITDLGDKLVSLACRLPRLDERAHKIAQVYERR